MNWSCYCQPSLGTLPWRQRYEEEEEEEDIDNGRKIGRIYRKYINNEGKRRKILIMGGRGGIYR